MDYTYIHPEIITSQASKKAGAVCGDLVKIDRTPTAATIVVSDGMGSGLRANIAANLGTARLLELLRRGFSPRQAFTRTVRTMRVAPEADLPYAVFTAARILPDGNAGILSYEMPTPILITADQAELLEPRPLTVDNELFHEINCVLRPGDSLCLVSDGISQAGMGSLYPMGWGMERACDFIRQMLDRKTPLHELPERLLRQSQQLSLGTPGDDCTCVLISARAGNSITLLTGPAADPANTPHMIERFLAAPGAKVICGATTSELVAKRLGRPVKTDPRWESLVAPPRYAIEGIDLATEGAVTLNQVYRVLTENPAEMEKQSGVTMLCRMLIEADRIHIIAGRASNPAHRHISFRQMGILPRRHILPLLHEKLTAAGKLVLLEWI